MKKGKPVKNAQTKASGQQDVIVLITTLVEKLTSLEAKIDTILSRISVRPVESPRQQQPVSAPAPVARPINTRPMYKAICADCGKNCEVPFQPSSGRSVYCKECFTARKNKGTFQPRVDSKPKEASPSPAHPVEKPQAAKPAAPEKKKKPAAKKPAKKKKK